MCLFFLTVGECVRQGKTATPVLGRTSSDSLSRRASASLTATMHRARSAYWA